MKALVAAGGLLALVLSTVACGSPVETANGPPPTVPSADPAPSLEAPSLSQPPGSASMTAPASDRIASAPAGAVVEDPSLLSILPAEIDGQTIVTEDGQFEAAIEDPDFAANVAAAAFGTAISAGDLASAVVARLNAGVYSDAFFRDWRDTYNDGACGQAGGLVGNAETQLNDQTVYIGSCAGGLRTYHAWLANRGVIVSAFSLGDRHYGEQLMAGLRP